MSECPKCADLEQQIEDAAYAYGNTLAIVTQERDEARRHLGFSEAMLIRLLIKAGNVAEDIRLKLSYAGQDTVPPAVAQSNVNMAFHAARSLREEIRTCLQDDER